jgi:soluble lytic murein transglycosylase
LLLGLLALALVYFAPWRQWLFPLGFRAQVMAQAARQRVPASLVWALIRQESNFQPRARSPVGAQGLMQLMPETAHWAAEHLEGDAPEDLHLDDPATNIRLGTAYLAYLRQRFPGDPVAVLAAYNAGPEPVLDWLQTAPQGRLRLEDIGYPETRAYVEKVLRNQWQYRRLYPQLQLEEHHL